MPPLKTKHLVKSNLKVYVNTSFVKVLLFCYYLIILLWITVNAIAVAFLIYSSGDSLKYRDHEE